MPGKISVPKISSSTGLESENNIIPITIRKKANAAIRKYMNLLAKTIFRL